MVLHSVENYFWVQEVEFVSGINDDNNNNFADDNADDTSPMVSVTPNPEGEGNPQVINNGMLGLHSSHRRRPRQCLTFNPSQADSQWMELGNTLM